MTLPSVLSVTCRAAPNIAVVKYWGKRSQSLILPINSSLSITMDASLLFSETTITLTLRQDRNPCVDSSTSVLTCGPPLLSFALDGISQSLTSDRLVSVIKTIYDRAPPSVDVFNGLCFAPGSINGVKDCIRKDEWIYYNMTITSHNSFPTAAGLASSASGMACLTCAVAAMFGFAEPISTDDRRPQLSKHVLNSLSSVARLGSGSACRSMLGGFVEWSMGQRDDGNDSIATQVADVDHWNDVVLIIVVCRGGNTAKSLGSTNAMERSMDTSELLSYRAMSVVPNRLRQMKAAILERQWNEFAIETMRDSNQFHAICQDTYPPVTYLNTVSRRVIEMVHAINDRDGVIHVAYTFDAGPNAVLITRKYHLSMILLHLLQAFPCSQPLLLLNAQNANKEGQVFLSVSTDLNSIVDNTVNILSSMRTDEIKHQGDYDLIERLFVSTIGGEPVIVPSSTLS